MKNRIFIAEEIRATWKMLKKSVRGMRYIFDFVDNRLPVSGKAIQEDGAIFKFSSYNKDGQFTFAFLHEMNI